MPMDYSIKVEGSGPATMPAHEYIEHVDLTVRKLQTTLLYAAVVLLFMAFVYRREILALAYAAATSAASWIIRARQRGKRSASAFLDDARRKAER